MAEQIRFAEFKISRKGFSCAVSSSLRNMRTEQLNFVMDPGKAKPDNDAIACVLSTITGKRYAEVYADIAVSKECREELEKFTSAQWHCPDAEKENAFAVAASRARMWLRDRLSSVSDGKADNRPRILLNFSGGFDSLAAYAVMPKAHTDLVAVDFGGYFQRETAYFQDFRPNTLHTNFRQLKYDRESWTFMGVGALLFAKQRNAEYIAFGTILEASPDNFNEVWAKKVKIYTPPFSLLGLKSTEFVRGLTEVGTAMIVTRYFPEQVTRSLASLAADGSEKRYRKQILTEIVCRRFGRSVELPECKIPGSKAILPFGENFALDFLALYELKHAGKEIVSHTVRDIPGEAMELSQRLSLEFYEKLNPWFLPTIPEEFREEYLQKLKDAGIEPYNDRDWAEFRMVRDYLTSLGYK